MGSGKSFTLEQTVKVPHTLKWHGGKYYLAQWIVTHFPEHKHYVEPYFGGGAVLFAKPQHLILNHSEVVNDINADLTNFWKVLQSPKLLKRFERLVTAVPFSQVEFEESIPCTGNRVQRAAKFFIRYRQSRQALGKSFANMSRSRTRRGMNEQASSWLSAIEGLPEVHKRLQSVVIFNKPALDLIDQEDSKHTLFYLDPPYLHDTRATTNDYEFEMSKADHRALLQRLGGIKGKFILSGYRSDLYHKYQRRFGWNMVAKQIPNNASGKRSKDLKTECLWMNF